MNLNNYFSSLLQNYRTFKGNFKFNKTWKDTFAQTFAKSDHSVSPHRPIKVSGIFSHALHQSWMCRNINLESTCKGFFVKTFAIIFLSNSSSLN